MPGYHGEPIKDCPQCGHGTVIHGRPCPDCFPNVEALRRMPMPERSPHLPPDPHVDV